MPTPVAPSHAAPAFSRPLVRYTTAISALAIPVVGLALGRLALARPSAGVLLGIIVFTVAAVVAEALPVPLDDTGTRSISLAFIFLLSSQILFGWQYAVLAAVASMGVSEARGRVPLRRGAFNVAVYAISTLASQAPHAVIDWNGRVYASADADRLVIVALLGGICFVILNVTLTSVAVSFAREMRLWDVIVDFGRSAGPAFGIMALMAALATSLWKLSPPLEFLLAGPLLSLGMYQRYAYRTALATRDAGTDGLTQLHNHRSYKAAIHDLIEDPEEGFALGVLDIDDFKQINDRFGHPVGDEVLTALAQVLREEAGEACAYRVGGEEFSILLPGGSAEDALAVLERLLERLAEIAFSHGEPVTISAGVASFPDMAHERDELERIADCALYWAKNHGKARACAYEPEFEHMRSYADIAAQADRVARLKAAENLVRIVEAKDTYTGVHSAAVSRLTVAIGESMGLESETVEYLRLAGLLHDLGKIAIPDSILQKAGALSEDERRVLREHAEIGYQLLQGADVSPIDLWIRHHHEAWDGTGYPHRLAGEDIPLGSRILLVADAFDAMVSDRVYRRGGTSAAALAELRRCSWQQFDARVVSALERHLASLELEATG